LQTNSTTQSFCTTFHWKRGAELVDRQIVLTIAFIWLNASRLIGLPHEITRFQLTNEIRDVFTESPLRSEKKRCLFTLIRDQRRERNAAILFRARRVTATRTAVTSADRRLMVNQ